MLRNIEFGTTFRSVEKCHSYLVAALVVLGSLNVHVSTDGLAGCITDIVGASFCDRFFQLMGSAILEIEIKKPMLLLVWTLAVKDTWRETVSLISLLQMKKG